VKEFRTMMKKSGIELPRNLVKHLGDEKIEKMVTVALGLAPLWENCLGKDWQSIMTREKTKSLFLKM
jgi:3-deoxy-alpha-D-manno-octulosonate 8-oxidase